MQTIDQLNLWSLLSEKDTHTHTQYDTKQMLPIVAKH